MPRGRCVTTPPRHGVTAAAWARAVHEIDEMRASPADKRNEACHHRRHLTPFRPPVSPSVARRMPPAWWAKSDGDTVGLIARYDASPDNLVSLADPPVGEGTSQRPYFISSALPRAPRNGAFGSPVLLKASWSMKWAWIVPPLTESTHSAAKASILTWLLPFGLFQSTIGRMITRGSMGL